MIARCHECGRTIWDGEDFQRTAFGPLCSPCGEALAQPEVVPDLTIRRYRDLRDVEQGRLLSASLEGYGDRLDAAGKSELGEH